jgi:3-oxoacyl-[acyl-carrier-protein] synthase III
VRRALVVASDVVPDPRRARGLVLRPAGVGIVAAATESGDGFVAFHSETFAEYAGLYEVRLDWLGPRRWLGGSGGHTIAVRAAESYAERCAACTVDSVSRFLEAQGLAVGDIDLVVAPDTPRGFARRVSAALDFPLERVVSEPKPSGAYSAAPGLALAAAIAAGRLRASRRTLLVTAGPGITVALALYGQVPETSTRHSCSASPTYR